MDVDVGGDEKKPLSSLDEQVNEEDAQPDPDEILQLDSGHGKVWLVKIPRFLMEKWSSVTAENQHLATLRIWQDRDPTTAKQPMILLIPPEKPGEPMEEYKLDMVQETVENQIVVAEVDKEPENPTSRAKTTVMTGKIRHEVHIKPKYDENYSNRMRARNEAASTPIRQIKLMDESHPAGRSAINMLSSGAGQRTAAFDSFIRTGKSSSKADKFSRSSRTDLLDRLFVLFKAQEFWTLKELKIKTEVPDSQIKETIFEIATLHRSGPHNGMFELLPNFKAALENNDSRPESMFSSDMEVPPDVKMEGVDDDKGDDDDDDDDDDDMEEVAS